MALFPLCRPAAGRVKVSSKQLVFYCLLLCLLIYFLGGRRTSSRPLLHSLMGLDGGGRQVVKGNNMAAGAGGGAARGAAVKRQRPAQTPWGAPLVWGDSGASERRRAAFLQQEVRTGLLVLAVGSYARYLRRFLSSAEDHFLPGAAVTYYVLTDSPRALEPALRLGPDRQLRVVPVAEMPGWERLSRRRMALLAAAIKERVGDEVDYVFCADVDQEFSAPVGEEILGDLVATLHPELYGMPRRDFPYEGDGVSAASVGRNEGDYYYTSELYGGLASQVYHLTRACSLLILQDQEGGRTPAGLEESYLNRYLIDHRPSAVLSPEYSWWDSPLAAEVPVRRLVSLGRQCDAMDLQKRETHNC